MSYSLSGSSVIMVMCCSDAENIDLFINDVIPSVIVEALLQCIYYGVTTVQSVTDDVEKFLKICLELRIKAKESKDQQWILELPFNADNLQKFLSSGELSDVTFVVEGEKLLAHRAVLCCHSDVLLAMLSGAFAEGHQKEVELLHMSSTQCHHFAFKGCDTELPFNIILLSTGMALY